MCVFACIDHHSLLLVHCNQSRQNRWLLLLLFNVVLSILDPIGLFLLGVVASSSSFVCPQIRRHLS